MKIDYSIFDKCYRCKEVKKRSEFRSFPCGSSGTCKACEEEYRHIRNAIQKEIRDEKPWKFSLKAAKKRCGNRGVYAERGIQCLLTVEDTKKIWMRDKAGLMKHPSLDRIDNTGDYVVGNCQFIEQSLNAAKGNRYFARYYIEN